jgi:GNAT superfamily N-acetyltransferase
MFELICSLCKRRPHIRPLTQAHYPDAHKIFKESFEFPDEEFRAIWNSRIEETCGYFVGYKLVAFAVIVKRKGAKFIYFLATAPEHRGKGIGSKILKHILAKVTSIYLYPISDRLISWYKNHGFYESSSGYYVYNTYFTRRSSRYLRF